MSKRNRNHEGKDIYKRPKSESFKDNDQVDGNGHVDCNDEVDGKLNSGIGFTPATSHYRNPCPKPTYNPFNNQTTCPASYPGENQRTRISKPSQSCMDCDTPDTHVFISRDGMLSRNLVGNSTYPPSSTSSNRRQTSPRRSSLDGEADLEQDVIIPQHVTHHELQGKPSDVSVAFVKSTEKLPYEQRNWFAITGRKGKPDELTNIIIPHDYATDTEAGDFFGAKLVTYRTDDKKTGRSFNQHFCVDVDQDGPAYKMKIQNWDELLIVGDTFVPVATHTEVLNIFHRAKVDGVTRFVMVIRRVAKPRKTPVTWQWYRTSAVLAPDKHAHAKGEPEVQKLEYTPLENNRYEMKHFFRFKITLTPNYLDIKESGITFGPLVNDTQQDITKNIWQHEICRDDGDSIPKFLCSLCDHGKRVYLGLDESQNIVPSNKQTWFEYNRIGNQFVFKNRDQQLYLAFDKKESTLTTTLTEYTFERFGLPYDKDEVDVVDDSKHRSGIVLKDSSLGKTSDTEKSAYECRFNTQLSSTNNCPVERLDDNGSYKIMTRSMSRQLSDARRDLSDEHISSM